MAEEPEVLLTSTKEKKSWAKSESKALIRRKLLSGEIKLEMKPKEVWDLDKEVHSAWSGKKYSSFTSGLGRLRKGITRDRGRMVMDVVSYGKDLAMVKACRQLVPNP